MITLARMGYDIFLEIRPKHTLLGIVRQCLFNEVGIWLPSLHPRQRDWQQRLQSLAQLYIYAIAINRSSVEQGYSSCHVQLTTYLGLTHCTTRLDYVSGARSLVEALSLFAAQLDYGCKILQLSAMDVPSSLSE